MIRFVSTNVFPKSVSAGPLHVATNLGEVDHKDNFRISPPGQERSEQGDILKPVVLDSAWKSAKGR